MEPSLCVADVYTSNLSRAFSVIPNYAKAKVHCHLPVLLI